MDFVTIESKQYIKSQDIRVFPCAYRGYYNSSTTPATTLVFDPEARATTEANFTNTFHKLSNNKESYVVAWVPDLGASTGTLKCVIGGYYFEIYNHEINDFFNSDSPYYLCINTKPISLGTSEPDETDARTTEVLSSFANTTDYLDVKQDNDYAFTGLLISTEATGTASLVPFIAVPNSKEGYDYKIDPTKLPVTNLLDIGSGNYSLRMIEDITEQGTNTTVASGDYSVSLGRGTAATGEASTALGNNTEASAKGAFTVGNNTTASGDGAVALGSATTASGTNAIALGNTTVASGTNAAALGSKTTASETNQVVIGQYNDYESDEAKNQAFIIANGTDEDNRSNKFTVSKAGDVKALGTLETKGNIKATGSSSNDLELGTSATGSSGSIKVYGTATTPVFSVENTGNTVIAGTTDISGITTITNDTDSISKATGALVVYGGVGVGENLNVGGTTNIAGKTTLSNDLDVTGAMTLNSTLEVTNTATLKGNTNIRGNITVDGTANIGGAVELTDALTVGGDTLIVGNTTLRKKVRIADSTLASGETAAFVVSGGEIIRNNLIINGTDVSTSTTTGALVVEGGIGIGSNLHVGGTTTVTGTTTLNDTLTVADGKTTTLGGTTIITSTVDYSKTDETSSAALVVNGGTYIAKKLHVEGDTTFYENLEIGSERVAIKKNTASTAANNGALTVVGGVGIGGNLNIAGSSNIAGNLTLAGTSGQCNTLQLGNESTSNKGGELLIYGTGTGTVFEVDNKGNTVLEGTLTVGNALTTSKKLTVDGTVEISSAGIKGLSGLAVAGQIDATVFNATSDARLKCNIEDYVFEKSILDLPIKRFEFIKDDSHTKYIGCLAQDLQQICPEFVNEASDGTLSIQESKIIYALLQEVKELKEKVNQLERR